MTFLSLWLGVQMRKTGALDPGRGRSGRGVGSELSFVGGEQGMGVCRAPWGTGDK